MDPLLAGILGLIGSGLALLSLGWNITAFLLTGTRVRVRIGVQVDRGEHGTTVTTTAVRWWRPWKASTVPPVQVPYAVVFLITTVHNHGRLPVTVENVAATSGPVGKSHADDTTELPYRLEPGSSMTHRMMLSFAEGVARGRRRPRKRFRVAVTLGSGAIRKSRRSYDLTAERPQADDSRFGRPTGR